MKRWRQARRMTSTALADAMGFTRTYVSHVEHGRAPGSAAFARKADEALHAGGEIWQAWTTSAGGTGGETGGRAPVTARGTGGLIVEDDQAELRYDGQVFTATMRRTIYNAGPDPVTRYLVRISVDRHPGDPAAAMRLYRAHPLTFDDLQLTARCNGEPMSWRPKHDRDSFKEVWLCFDNGDGRFPLYPGERAVLEYSYRVSDQLWGPWFQRAVRLPTHRLSVRLVFPAGLDPRVWGTETSETAEAVPLHTPVEHSTTASPDGEVAVFEWRTSNPPLNARYRLEWALRGRPADGGHGPDLRTPSDRMRAAGIVQQGDPILGRAAVPFDLPAETEQARRLVDELLAAMVRVREHHVFGKGMGLAAPQIGSPRAAAIVQPPGDDAEPVVLLNPNIIAESAEHDEQYEGCLSLFDVRGMVPSALRLEVEHTALDGTPTITVFTDAMARLVRHEVDHLAGHLYLDRMRPGVTPISVAEYRGAGHPWSYRAR
ncbi:peptide deformylase [Actinomadura hibisca]|uniref:peptide deformylase n=1 Tax=Actinomadura hibisca TaxID=68565 RepID=UPI0024804A5B|nr:peptide deformylase [Actinomadura hibisca]